MAQVDREFLKNYHRAIVKSISKDLEKVKSRIGSEWAEEFRRRADTRLEGEEFHRTFQDYLQNGLRFSEEVKVSGNDEEMEIEVKGCHICHANEELRKEGSPTLCPIVPTGLFSLSRVAGRKATLKEVRKEGVVGECRICYKID